jgi:hypothetical protein
MAQGHEQPPDADASQRAKNARLAAGSGGERALACRRLSPQAALLIQPIAEESAPVGRPRLLLQGLDSLYVSYYVDTTTPTFDWDELAYEKEKVRQSKGKKFKELPFGTETLALMPAGGHPYTYVLRNQDFIIRLGERINPACHVQFLSQGLWANGYQAQHARIVAWLNSVNLRRTRLETISRADWAFDYLLPVMDFGTPNIVSRAAIEAVWMENKQVQTFQVGKGDTVLRIYDKMAEVTQSSDKLWFLKLWGVSESVWRVEVQARNERLKQAAIRTIQDLSDLGGDLLREVTSQHTTLRRVVGDTNRSRWPLHPLWDALHEDIARLDQTGLIRDISSKAGLEWRRRRLTQSVYGYLKRLATFEALQSDGKQVPDLEWVMEALQDGLNDFHDAGSWRSDVERLVAEERLGL